MKKFAAVLAGAAILTSSISFAAVSSDKIALGKVTPGMSINDLIAAYGQPNSKHGDDWHYSHFTVEIDDDRPNVVEKVSTRTSGIATPNGVMVGQNASVLNSTFGTADKVDSEHDGTEYEYFSTDRTKKIEFKVRDNVIVKISCNVHD